MVVVEGGAAGGEADVEEQVPTGHELTYAVARDMLLLFDAETEQRVAP